MAKGFTISRVGHIGIQVTNVARSVQWYSDVLGLTLTGRWPMGENGERPEVAQAEVHRWFSLVYHNPNLTTAGGVYGTPEQVQEQLEELVAMGANHLLLNPVTRYTEQVEALAEVVGLQH